MNDTETTEPLSPFHEQLMEPFGVQPNTLVEQRDLPGVLAPRLAVPCDVNLVSPCRESDPSTAMFMVRYADCDCDTEEEDFTLVAAWCRGCMEFIVGKPYSQCSCGLVFKPAHEIFDDIVPIR